MKKTSNKKTITNKTNQNSNYDWFRGNVGNNKQLSPKEKAHKVWKIVRMFIYIALAALSLTGCIQSFVIKTPGGVGQGLEVYSSKANVAPNVTTLKMMDNGALTIQAKEHYWLGRNESNGTTKKAKNKTLTAIQKQVGEGYWQWITENRAMRLVNEKGEGLKDFTSTKGSIENTLFEIGAGQYAVVGEHGKNSILTTAKIAKTPKLKLFFPKFTDAKKHNDYSFISVEIEAKSKDAIGEHGQGKKLSPSYNQSRILNQLIYNLYVTQLKKSKLYTEAMKAFNDINANKNTPISKENILKIGLYQSNISNLNSIFGLEKVVAYDTNKNGENVAKTSPTAQLSNGSNIFAFQLASGNKQRAIFDWSTSWHLGPFYGLFVYPLSKLTLGISGGLPSESAWHGWEMILTLLITVVIIRTFAYALTFKSTLQQVKQQELSAKRAAIEAKYLQYKGNKQMEQRKRQEMSDMFKKEGISPLGSLGSMFLTMPIFLSMWKIIGGLPQFKSTNWLGINFAATSWRELLYNKGWQYLPLMLIAGLVQGISIILPRILTKKRDKKRINAQQKEALKKANKTQNIMAIFFIGFAIIMSAGIQVYWIFGGLFTTGQNILNHFIIKKQSQKRKSRKLKSK